MHVSNVLGKCRGVHVRSHASYAEPCDVEVFIRILYLRAAFRVNLLNREFIWNHESSHDVFAAMMSENRFKFISCFITFHHHWNWSLEDWQVCLYKGTFWGNEWKKHKNEVSISSASNWRNTTHTVVVLASSSITLANLWSMVYCIGVSVILGQPTHTSLWDMLGNQKALMVLLQSTITGTNEYIKYLVNEFSAYNSIQLCNISMDRYFTLMSLAAWALENK